ncbi:MAG TPA: HAD family acid phosphatase [Longimicrobiaceae bacterium]|nr:HAD family acid phosphatase [Longimicrobiaceae bacterium]
MKRAVLLLPLFLLGACAPTAPPAAAPAPSTTADAELPLSLRWFRASAEAHAAYLQAYRGASEHVRAIAPSLAGSDWGVILDADETVLDNSAYELRRARAGLGYSEESWNAWVREQAAPALPGAVAFTQLVKELGGRVVIVTNRAAAVCPETRANLLRDSIPAAVVLCAREGSSDKNPRFQAVQQGSVPGIPALKVVMWVGDNIQDFPGLTQAEMRSAPASAFAEFGRSWWILPNPLYGSWEKNPVP